MLKLTTSSLAILAATSAFAGPAKPKGEATPEPSADATPPAGSTNAGKTYAPRVEPVILGVSAAVPMPSRATTRGSKSAYDFAALTAVGMSIAVGNKTAAQLSSVVSNANKKATKDGAKQATNPDGTPQFEMVDMKDAAGNVIGQVPDSTKPIMLPVPHYFAADVDPATDPDKATARIFRNK